MFASGRVRINQNEQSYNKIVKGETSRINQFQDDMVICGTLRGFKRFMTQLRSRDELLIKLFKDPSDDQNEKISQEAIYSINNVKSGKMKLAIDASVRSHVNSYPILKASAVKSVSKNTLTKLEKSTPGGGSRISKYTAWAGLPISETQTYNDASKSTFLLGAYMKRKVPMVWLLADQHHLGSNPGAAITKPLDLDEEDPLILDSLSNWYKEDVSFLDVISEILCTSFSSNFSEVNPFEVNFDYFLHLPNEEVLILVPSIISFLTKIITKVTFPDQVLNDIEELHLVQLNCLEALGNTPDAKSVKSP